MLNIFFFISLILISIILAGGLRRWSEMVLPVTSPALAARLAELGYQVRGQTVLVPGKKARRLYDSLEQLACSKDARLAESASLLMAVMRAI